MSLETPQQQAESSYNEALACRACGEPIETGANFCPGCGASTMGDLAPDPLVGRIVADRYRIVQLLGRGGMGVVYKCEHTRMGKLMAIKLLHGDLARDTEVQTRFRREAQAASRLSHPNTAAIFDFGSSDGLMYLVMEYIAGEDLGRVLRANGHIASARAAAITAQACGSLAEAHEKGIVHRDLKPENLLITPLKDGREWVKLLDFGLAKLREGEDRNEITGGGMLIGTPYYMAPEIIRGGNADHRVDVYGLGAVLYRAITGVPAFTGPSPVAVLTRALTEDLIPPSRRRPELQLSTTLDAIIARCMSRTPDDRYARIDDVRAALIEYLHSEGFSDSWMSETGLGRSTTSGSLTPRAPRRSDAPEIATRTDVEEFEKTIRRGRYATVSATSLVLIGALVGGLLLWRKGAQALQRGRDTEVEPNNTKADATRIETGREVRGQIGQRIAPDRGDVDVYRVVLPPGSWRLRATLGAVPTMDLALELIAGGQPRAAAVADDRGLNAREVLAGFRVGDTEREYYLSVHERVVPGVVPLETVSDWYALRYTLEPLSETEEVEPNDRAEVASSLRIGTTQRGYVEARGDIDLWCLERAPTEPLHAQLQSPESLDLELVLHPQSSGAERITDAQLGGGTETMDIPAMPGERPPCLIVRASTQHPPAHGEAEQQYVLRVDR